MKSGLRRLVFIISLWCTEGDFSSGVLIWYVLFLHMGAVVRIDGLLQVSSLVLFPVSVPVLHFLRANFQDKGGDIRDLWVYRAG